MSPYTISISGKTLEIGSRYLTGDVLLQYLATMTETQLKPATLHNPYELRPKDNKPYGTLYNIGDIIDLANECTDFVLTPIQVRAGT